LLLQWQGPFEVLERVRGDDYKIQLAGRTKMYHANMLKKYWIREHEELSAMVIEPEEREKDEMNLFTSLQTETYRDVRINPELTEEQRGVVMKLLEKMLGCFHRCARINGGFTQILRLPDFDKEFVLRTDACNDGIGAILFQEDSEIKHPVAFASRKLLTRESHYSTTEKECLAIVWAVQKFQNFLYGKLFILETDHQPLLYLGKAQYGQNGRLMKWALILQQYQFTVRAIKGSENVGADFLSRHSVTS